MRDHSSLQNMHFVQSFRSEGVRNQQVTDAKSSRPIGVK